MTVGTNGCGPDDGVYEMTPLDFSFACRTVDEFYFIPGPAFEYGTVPFVWNGVESFNYKAWACSDGVADRYYFNPCLERGIDCHDDGCSDTGYGYDELGRHTYWGSPAGFLLSPDVDNCAYKETRDAFGGAFLYAVENDGLGGGARTAGTPTRRATTVGTRRSTSWTP